MECKTVIKSYGVKTNTNMYCYQTRKVFYNYHYIYYRRKTNKKLCHIIQIGSYYV